MRLERHLARGTRALAGCLALALLGARVGTRNELRPGAMLAAMAINVGLLAAVAGPVPAAEGGAAAGRRRVCRVGRQAEMR